MSEKVKGGGGVEDPARLLRACVMWLFHSFMEPS